MKKNPFSIYDILGYLIPGAILIFAFTYIENGNIPKQENYDVISVFFILSYVIGHLLSYISSVTIEKFGNLTYGYPSKFILGYEHKKRKGNFKLFIFNTFLFPLYISELVFGNWFGLNKLYNKKVDNYLIKIIEEKVIRLLNSLSLSENTEFDDKSLKSFDFHRIVSHYTFENSQSHQFRMVNYVVLYGFLRTLVLIFVILFWFCLCNSIHLGNSIDLGRIARIIGLGILSFLSFMAYMKFYRRYTLEGLMLVVIDKSIGVKKETQN